MRYYVVIRTLQLHIIRTNANRRCSRFCDLCDSGNRYTYYHLNTIGNDIRNHYNDERKRTETQTVVYDADGAACRTTLSVYIITVFG